MERLRIETLRNTLSLIGITWNGKTQHEKTQKHFYPHLESLTIKILRMESQRMEARKMAFGPAGNTQNGIPQNGKTQNVKT
jgi:hypothetical protein